MGGIKKDESHIECLKREFLEETGYVTLSFKELVSIDCYWLANNKYPLLSRANIFEVEIDLNNKNIPLEDNHYIEWIDISDCVNYLPLPYHKKAMEWYIGKR